MYDFCFVTCVFFHRRAVVIASKLAGKEGPLAEGSEPITTDDPAFF